MISWLLKIRIQVQLGLVHIVLLLVLGDLLIPELLLLGVRDDVLVLSEAALGLDRVFGCVRPVLFVHSFVLQYRTFARYEMAQGRAQP